MLQDSYCRQVFPSVDMQSFCGYAVFLWISRLHRADTSSVTTCNFFLSNAGLLVSTMRVMTQQTHTAERKLTSHRVALSESADDWFTNYKDPPVCTSCPLTVHATAPDLTQATR